MRARRDGLPLRLHRRCLTLLVGLLGSLGACAHAPEAPGGHRAQIAQARQVEGAAHLAAGRYAEAVAALLAAERGLPGDAPLQLQLGAAFRGVGRPDLAAWHYRSALRLDPGLHQARLRLADLQIEQGRVAQALRGAWAVLLDEPSVSDRVGALVLAGRALRGSGRLRAARGVLLRAVALRPSSGAALVELGVVARLERRRGRALYWFSSAIRAEATPSMRAEAHYRMAEILAALGDQPAAVQHLRVSASLDAGWWGRESRDALGMDLLLERRAPRHLRSSEKLRARDLTEDGG